MDNRVSRLARVLIRYSLKLKQGDLFKIQGEAVALPLIKAAYEEALKIGAHPYVQIRIPDNEEQLFKLGSDAQLAYMSPMIKVEVDKMDALMVIWGTENSRFLANVDPKRQAFLQRAMKPLIQKRFARMGSGSLRWVGTLFPTLADAQEADLSLRDFEDFVYGAGHIDSTDPIKHWEKVEAEQARLVKILDTLDQVHVRTNDTDLKLRVKGRSWINCAGTKNFPDGEIFTGPIENSADGHIRYSYPAVYQGREVADVRLEFKKGRVVKESAGKNGQFLTSMLNLDRGARLIGEFAIGTNYEIKRFSRNILFDEKIGGTCHLAVGASIPESGGKNKSSLHWDMVCDLHHGEISADGKTIYRNGKFVI